MKINPLKIFPFPAAPAQNSMLKISMEKDLLSFAMDSKAQGLENIQFLVPDIVVWCIYQH